MRQTARLASLPRRQFAISLFKKAANPQPLVEFSIKDLAKKEKSSDIMEGIERAYSKNGGLGAILISDIPHFEQMNQKMGDWSYKINNHFSNEEINELKRPDAKYMIGYNLGAMELDGFVMSEVSTLFTLPFQENFPLFNLDESWQNIWPPKHPQLKQDVIDSSTVLLNAKKLLANHIDYYLDEKIKGKRIRVLDLMEDKKAPHFNRIGYCFPIEAQKDSLWHQWHSDFSLLTGLCPNICFNEKGETIHWDQEDAGLFVMNAQTYEVQKYRIPSNCLCVQVGEYMQILSGGELMATPHGVIAQDTQPKKLTRAAFVFFSMPPWETKLELPEGKTVQDLHYKEDYPLYQYAHLGDRWDSSQIAIDFFRKSTELFFG